MKKTLVLFIFLFNLEFYVFSAVFSFKIHVLGGKNLVLLNSRMFFGTIENRTYREEFTRKKCKTAILLYCFHTAGVLYIFITCWALQYHFIENLKLLLKENQIMKYRLVSYLTNDHFT